MKLSTRMKKYEESFRYRLPRRLPVIVRLDGNSFSKLTKSCDFEKPFDRLFENAMDETCIALLEYCHAEFAYFQSDEISLLLKNGRNQTPFLSNRVQKLTSLLASTASVAFSQATNTNGVFDARCFILPKHEVVNYFIWRQEDAFKNCVSSFAYHGLKSKYGSKKARNMLHGQSTDQRQEIIFQEIGTNVNNIPTHRKRGTLVESETYEQRIEDVVDDEEKLSSLIEKGHVGSREEIVTRSKWVCKKEIPRFTQNRSFISDRV